MFERGKLEGKLELTPDTYLNIILTVLSR